MLSSTAARIELLVCLANALSFICANCVQSADLQVCFPASFTGFPNDQSPEEPAAVGIAHRIRRAVLATAAGVSGKSCTIISTSSVQLVTLVTSFNAGDFSH